MKLSIKTVVLQEMVGKAIKGASCNKLIPLTSLMAIVLKDKQLKMISTDGSNYLYVMQDNIEGDDFYVVVYAEQFAKLISKLTSENTTLTLDKGVLSVNANGNYKIELPLDPENGELIQYPDPVAEAQIDGEEISINLSTIKTILNTNKAALAITMEEPAYTNYYVGDKVVTSDFTKICALDVKVFDEPMLISPQMMNLLDVMTEEKIGAYVKDDIIEFVTKDCIVYGPQMEGIEDYDIDAISGLINEKFKSTCEINKTAMLSLLDRIALFVGVNDKRAITLTFTKEGIDISSKQSSGVESIEYIKSTGFKAFTCSIDVLMLIQQIKANDSDTLHLQYGNDKSIKFVEGNVMQILATMNDEE